MRGVARINLELPQELLASLDALVSRLGEKRNVVLRGIIREKLEREARRVATGERS